MRPTGRVKLFHIEDQNFSDASFLFVFLRTWFWFPMFSFFESEIDCKIPNEFEFPITMSSIHDFYQDLWGHFILKAQSTVPNQENEPAKVTTTRNVTRKKAKAKQT